MYRPSPVPTRPTTQLPPLVVQLNALASALSTVQRTALESRWLRLDTRTMSQLQTDLGITQGALQSSVRSSSRVVRTRLRLEQFAELRSRLVQLREGLGSIAPLDHPHTRALIRDVFGSDLEATHHALTRWLAGPYPVQHGRLVLLGTNVTGVEREVARVLAEHGPESDELAETLDRHGVTAPFRASLVERARHLRRCLPTP